MMSFDLFYMQIVSVGLLVLAAHFGSKITRSLKIGEVVGQVLGGLVVGPILLLLIEERYPVYRQALQSLHFFTFAFLSLIAFGLGDELNRRKLKRVGKDVLVLTLTEGLLTWVCVTVTFLLLGFEPLVALIIGSIGIATAPAATFAIMNRLHIGGRMRSMLGGLVVVDDVIEIIIFSLTCQIALLLQGGKELSAAALMGPLVKDLGLAALVGGGVFAVLALALGRRWLRPPGPAAQSGAPRGPEFLSRLISEMPGPSVDVFLIVAGCVCLGVGLSLHWGLPFLITAVTTGILISNFYSRELFQSLRIEGATSMQTLIFFALIGANADIEAFHPENFGLIAAYIGARSVGKIGGAWLGCKIVGIEPEIRKTLPKLMLPQAGVAAVEAFYVATVLGQTGQMILSVILPGLIFFEIVGVLCSERALLKWRAWMLGAEQPLSDEDLLREKLQNNRLHLDEVLQPHCLRVPLDVSSEGEAVWELIRTLESAGLIKNPGQVLQIVMQRQRQGGITLGEGTAIPHGRVPGLEHPAVALGILPRDRPIACGGPGDVPVDIIYLVLTPPEPPELHLQILAAIATLLNDRGARQRLRQARNERQAMQIIHDFCEENSRRQAASTAPPERGQREGEEPAVR